MTDDNLRLGVAINGYGLRSAGGGREVLSWRDVRQIVETAEETGYEAVFTPEIGAREAFSTLTAMAETTRRMRLATGVVPIGSRDARRMAMEAATLHDLSGGRFTLGLGSREPIHRTRRELDGIRALLRGEAPPADLGATLAAGPLDLFPGRLPIFLAALGPRMTELAGEVADGVLLNWCTPQRVARAKDEVARGAVRAGRGADAVTIAVYVRCCLGHEDGHALPALAEQAGQYATMPYYLRQFEAMGLGEESRTAGEAWEAGRSEDVPESLVRSVCVLGDRGEARARLAAYRDAGADLVVVYPVPVLDAASSIFGSLFAAAPSPEVERRSATG
jgi:alkanesulfonate monooxygenase SsuD/methylene tetrahydromethanopterin reductase-like flavin-dependent oxidoreductase (luciferase family)